MGYKINKAKFNDVLAKLSETYDIYAPKRAASKGRFSDTDLVKYEKVQSFDEMAFDVRSNFSFKELVLPITETLFYFTEDNINVPNIEEKSKIIFVRSCDMHAIRRLDEIYLKNGFEDFYYKRLRNKVKFALVGCSSAFDNCFCVDMKTNQTSDYHFSINLDGDTISIDSKFDELDLLLEGETTLEVTPAYVTDTPVRVELPTDVPLELFESDIWDEYNARCISCGRCNFSCPTCTCYTMQDIFYEDNGKVGERRRVWASCHVDGYTEMAGNHSFRDKKSQRMRFKVHHKVYDFNKRFGYHMCVGCGRCDHVCPEYISFSNSINKLSKAVKEGK